MSLKSPTSKHRCTTGPSVLLVESDPGVGRWRPRAVGRRGYQPSLAGSWARWVLARDRAPVLALLGGLGSVRGALDLLEEIRAGDHEHGTAEHGQVKRGVGSLPVWPLVARLAGDRARTGERGARAVAGLRIRG